MYSLYYDPYIGGIYDGFSFNIIEYLHHYTRVQFHWPHLYDADVQKGLE